MSTIADVRAILGKPTLEYDDTIFDEPYPGDEAAKEPILRFDDGGPWIVEVRFVRTDAAARLVSVDLLPRHSISFARIAFPPSFVKRHGHVPHFAWLEYRHPSGLVYSICTSSTPYSEVQPGDLMDISYGVSDQARKVHGADRSN